MSVIHDMLSASNFKDRKLRFQVGNLSPQAKFIMNTSLGGRVSGFLPPSLSLPPTPSDPSLSAVFAVLSLICSL